MSRLTECFFRVNDYLTVETETSFEADYEKSTNQPSRCDKVNVIYFIATRNYKYALYSKFNQFYPICCLSCADRWSGLPIAW